MLLAEEVQYDGMYVHLMAFKLPAVIVTALISYTDFFFFFLDEYLVLSLGWKPSSDRIVSSDGNSGRRNDLRSHTLIT